MKRSAGNRLYNVHEAALLTRLEESKIRYFEKIFPEFFNAQDFNPSGTLFDDRQILLLRRIDELIAREHCSAAQVKSALASLLGQKKRSVRILSVTSGKGGVGKTTISLNLGITLSRMGFRTLIFDADLGMANIHVLAGVAPGRTLLDFIAGRAAFEDTLTEGPAGTRMLCGSSGISELANLDDRALASVGRELERTALSFDFIVVDTAAGISSQVVRFLMLADDIIVVVTPNTASVLDAYGVLKVARQSGARGNFDLLINKVKDELESRRVTESITACARKFLGFAPGCLGYLLDDDAVETSIRCGSPLVLSHPASPYSLLLQNVAFRLCERRESMEPETHRENDLMKLFLGKFDAPEVASAAR